MDFGTSILHTQPLSKYEWACAFINHGLITNHKWGAATFDDRTDAERAIRAYRDGGWYVIGYDDGYGGSVVEVKRTPFESRGANFPIPTPAEQRGQTE